MKFSNFFQSSITSPRFEKVRHEVRRRQIRVEAVLRLTPGMLRITFSGDDLASFTSLAFDDHLKIFVPTAAGEVEARDYTPRRYDSRGRTLVVDFAIHEAGPATRWALEARVGDILQIGGPKGSKIIVADDVWRWLLIGDETALPAIGRHIEETRPGVQITSVVAIVGSQERQDFETSAHLTALWAYRPLTEAHDPGALFSVVRTLKIHPETFVWIAGEAAVARALRNHFVEERGHSTGWIKTGGYWVMGRSDAHERL